MDDIDKIIDVSAAGHIGGGGLSAGTGGAGGGGGGGGAGVGAAAAALRIFALLQASGWVLGTYPTRRGCTYRSSTMNRTLTVGIFGAISYARLVRSFVPMLSYMCSSTFWLARLSLHRYIGCVPSVTCCRFCSLVRLIFP